MDTSLSAPEELHITSRSDVKGICSKVKEVKSKTSVMRNQVVLSFSKMSEHSYFSRVSVFYG